MPAGHEAQEEHFILVLLEGLVGLAVAYEDILDAIPKLFVRNDRLVLSVEDVLLSALVLEPDLSDIEMVGQDVRDLFFVEFCASGGILPSDVELLGPVTHFIELVGDLSHGSQLGIKLEAELNDLRFFLVDHKLLFLHVVSEWHESATPHASFGHGEALVVGPLLRHFPFELGEFQHDVEEKPSCRGGGVKVLGCGNEFDVVLVENFEKGVEILVVAGEPVDLVDDNGLDALALDIFDKLFQGSTVERSPGLSGIFIDLEDLPSEGFLAFDVRNAAITLVIERGISLCLRPLVHRDPRIDRTIYSLIIRV